MKNKPKLIDSFWVLITATAFLGPLAIPLLWKNPRYSFRIKMMGSFAILGFTAFLIYLSKVVLVEFLNT